MSIIELRVKLLKEMDAYAREHFQKILFMSIGLRMVFPMQQMI
jgi:hypothetical protein